MHLLSGPASTVWSRLTRMLLLVAFALAVTACGSDDSGGSDDSFDSVADNTTSTQAEPARLPTASASFGQLGRGYGTNDTACRSVMFGNLGDPDQLQVASECLLAEIAAGRAVVLDYALISTEGDPIYFRYAFDGQQILVVNDNRLDAFGSQEIVAQLCESVGPGRIVPEASGCSATTSTGFAEADR